MSRTNKFSVEEDTYIKSNFRDLLDDEIAEHLNRPVGSITRRRQRLGCWYVQQEVDSNLKGEVWKQIKDLPEGYYVSNKGRVKSGKKICSLYINSKGYVQWRIVNKSKGIAKSYKIHRLVAIHFNTTEKVMEDCDVHHIDHNRQNNSSCNLEWLTPSEHKLKHST